MLLKMPGLKVGSLVLDILRVALGISLLLKGLYFLNNMNVLFENVSMASSGNDFVIAHIIIAAHIVGGVCLAIGLLTRFMAAINIPILLGALMLVHAPGNNTSPTEFEAAFITFTLLCVSLYFGSSKRSVDYLINHDEDLLEHDFLKNIINLNNRKPKKMVRKKVNPHKHTKEVKKDSPFKKSA